MLLHAGALPSCSADIPCPIISAHLGSLTIIVLANPRLVPLVGDVALAAWKANWRNANALEAFLKKRGEDQISQAESHDQQFQGEAQAEVQPDSRLGHEQAVLATDPDGYGTIAPVSGSSRRPAPAAPVRQ